MKIGEIMNHPRISQMLRTSSATEKFLLVSVLRSNDAEDTEEILNNLFPSGPVYGGTVAGAPLVNWLGKSVDQIRRELESLGDVDDVDGAIGEIHAAIEQATGVKPSENPQLDMTSETFDRRTSNPGTAELTPRDPNRLTTAQRRAGVQQTGGDGGAGGDVSGKNDEPTIGEDQVPASQLFGKTDAELLEMEGVGPATVRKLRAYQAERGVALPDGGTDGGKL